MSTDHSIPPLRDLPPGRLEMRKAHLLSEIALQPRRGLRRPLHTRLRLVAAGLALAAAVGILAAPGWGLGFKVVDLFTGEPAPRDVQQAVHGADVGAPPVWLRASRRTRRAS